ncbi:MAG: hypothetical protein SFY32_02780 [Bacteroidota bacterium]|nr:hypothetical protein [Bacteroidota bacterium]
MYLSFGFVTYIFACIYVLIHTDPLTVHVDRWDAIIYWWDAFFKGTFPYAARTRWGGFPSPLPFLQLIYLPSYLEHEIGLTNMLLAPILVLYLRHFRKLTINNTLITLYLLISSLPLWWEISVRSTLFINGLFALLILDVCYLLLSNGSFKSSIISGIIIGLMVSSRLIMIIPLISGLSFIYFNKVPPKSILLLIFCAFSAFVVTFVPLIWIWDIESLLKNNPFIHHNNHMPIAFTIIYLITSISIGYYVKNKLMFLMLNGILLYVIALVFVGNEIFKYGISEAYLSNHSTGDISYFILSIPILVSTIPITEVEKSNLYEYSVNSHVN